MRIDVHFTPDHLDEMTFRDKTVVIIDVLRASTSIIAALANGARQIIPATTVESAVKISGNLFGDAFLLAGERNGKMIEGFDLGNSPSEFSEDVVGGKSIIFSSTNGSQALAKGRFARHAIVCAFTNISAVARFLHTVRTDLAILCAGNGGQFSLEDAVCAGMLVQKLPEEKLDSFSDGALAARALHKTYGRSILKMLRISDHGRQLEELGYGKDLALCASTDSVRVIPVLEGNIIKAIRHAEQDETTVSAPKS
jgi:2-phosphosulfolactate phosphatase